MTGGTYVLVVLSAAAHAYWNFLLKRSGGDQAFIGLSKIVEAIFFALVLTTGIVGGGAAISRLWVWPAIGALLVLLNYMLLAAAYRHGDLSLVYPLSRGAILVFLPPIAFVAFNERLDVIGWLAVGVIASGIALLPLANFSSESLRACGQALRAPATVYALLAALVAACYTAWDKRAVQLLSPLTYFAAYTVVVGLAYGLLLSRIVPRPAIASAWKGHRSAILQVAALNSASYLLALVALQNGKASYVIALRQLSVAAGAGLGAWFLGEVIAPPRRLAIACVVLGCVLLALAR